MNTFGLNGIDFSALIPSKNENMKVLQDVNSPTGFILSMPDPGGSGSGIRIPVNFPKPAGRDVELKWPGRHSAWWGRSSRHGVVDKRPIGYATSDWLDENISDPVHAYGHRARGWLDENIRNPIQSWQDGWQQ